MILYRVDVDVTAFRSYCWGSIAVEEKLDDEFDSDRKLKPQWKAPRIKIDPSTKRLPAASFGDVDTHPIVVTRAAVEFLAAYPKTHEVLPLVGPEKGDDFCAVHVFSKEIVPRGHRHSSVLGHFCTALDEELCMAYPLCRDRVHRGTDGKAVPGIYKFCTEEFKERYDASGLTGLLFEVYWPLDERIAFLREKTRQDAAAEARGQMLKANTSKSSPLPTGKVSEPVVSWKTGTQPTPEQLAEYLWQDVIDRRMTGNWLGDAVSNNTPDRKGTITDLAAQAVTHLLNSGVDRNVLCHLARSICFESINRTFMTLEETGIKWPGGKPDWESLVFALVQNATTDKKGRCGGWPPK